MMKYFAVLIVTSLVLGCGPGKPKILVSQNEDFIEIENPGDVEFHDVQITIDSTHTLHEWIIDPKTIRRTEKVIFDSSGIGYPNSRVAQWVTVEIRDWYGDTVNQTFQLPH